MKATGIVRRIDDLGRVVIPKEIRRTLRIREGDPLEIFTEKDGKVIFKKYSPMVEWSDSANQLCNTLNKMLDSFVAIADRDTFISVFGPPKRSVHEKRISQDLEKIMEGRGLYQRKAGDKLLPISDENEKYIIEVAAPILAEGDVLGCVVFFSDGNSAPVGEVEYKLAQTVAVFLGKQMEG